MTIGALMTLLLMGHAGLLHAAETKKPPSSGAVTEESVISRIDNLKRLVNISKGAQRVLASDNAEALKKQRHAVTLIEEAEQKRVAGDYAAANKLLNGVTMEMFAAIRIVGDPEKGQKNSDEFDNKENSVNELLKALGRIAGEKNASEGMLLTIESIKGEVARAHKIKEEGNVDKAKEMVDAAYVAAKKAVEEMRGGDTLTKTLHFANKEEEYHYEIDRNETHKMLVTVLLREKVEKESMRKMVERFTTKADELRAQAALKAGDGDYDQAVELLESSTKELVRAIRMGGIYIPG